MKLKKKKKKKTCFLHVGLEFISFDQKSLQNITDKNVITNLIFKVTYKCQPRKTCNIFIYKLH